jgi:hypothetical protein
MEWTIWVAGFFGGVLRGTVGYTKYLTTYKNVSFKPIYFLITVITSGILGLCIAFVFDGSMPMAFVLGYAGGDFLENVYKIVLKKPTLFGMPELQ